MQHKWRQDKEIKDTQIRKEEHSACIDVTLHTDLPYFIHFTLLSFTDTAFFTSWRFVATLCHFSNNVCSLYVSVSHFGNFWNTANFFIISIFVMVLCNLWSWKSLLQQDYDLTKAWMMASIFLAIKLNTFFIKVYTLFF